MIRLKLFMIIFFFIIIVYLSFRFLQLLIKMNQQAIIPKTAEEMKSLRNFPQKPVDYPSYSKQKLGIILYILMLIFVIVIFVIGALDKTIDWWYFLLFFLPLVHSDNLLNLFAVVDDGLISGNRFVSWKRIKSFRFAPIDVNHRFYGYSKEVNGGYELKIRVKYFSISCIVTSKEMKEKLAEILSEHGAMNETRSELEDIR